MTKINTKLTNANPLNIYITVMRNALLNLLNILITLFLISIRDEIMIPFMQAVNNKKRDVITDNKKYIMMTLEKSQKSISIVSTNL